MYHEVLSISNCYNSLTSAEYSFRETDIHHELGGNLSNRLNSCAQVVVSFIEAQGNPFETAVASKLHNFTTGQCVPEEVSVRLLIFLKMEKKDTPIFEKKDLLRKIKNCPTR